MPKAFLQVIALGPSSASTGLPRGRHFQKIWSKMGESSTADGHCGTAENSKVDSRSDDAEGSGHFVRYRT